MVWNWKFLGEAKCRWVPTLEANASHAGGLPLDYAHPESSHRHALPPSGPRPASQQRRGPPI
jgi:hypothetical protein